MLEAGFRGELRSYRDQPMELIRDGIAKTFRYLDEEEVAKQKKAAQGAKK